MAWPSGQERAAAQSQAEAEQASRISLANWSATDPNAVSANLSKI
jgi:hypothetical protein